MLDLYPLECLLKDGFRAVIIRWRETNIFNYRLSLISKAKQFDTD